MTMSSTSATFHLTDKAGQSLWATVALMVGRLSEEQDILQQADSKRCLSWLLSVLAESEKTSIKPNCGRVMHFRLNRGDRISMDLWTKPPCTSSPSYEIWREEIDCVIHLERSPSCFPFRSH